jgi:hypothetical protein
MDIPKLLISLALVATSAILLRRSIRLNTPSQCYPRYAGLACALAAVLLAATTSHATHPARVVSPAPKSVSFDAATQDLQAGTVRTVYTIDDNTAMFANPGEVAFVDTKEAGWAVTVVPPGFAGEFDTLLAKSKASSMINPPQPIYNDWMRQQGLSGSPASTRGALWYLMAIAAAILATYAAVFEAEKRLSISRLEVELGLRRPKIPWLIHSPRAKR